MRVLLIHKEVKRCFIPTASTQCLRVLLIHKEVKLERYADILQKYLRVLLIHKEVKQWGIGLSMNDPDRFDMNKWKGQNLLGYALMMIRKKL